VEEVTSFQKLLSVDNALPDKVLSVHKHNLGTAKSIFF